MTDILDAISASLDLAIFITKQVEKVIDAPGTVQIITDDVRCLSRILGQLSDTLRPDPRAGYTAVRLSNQGLNNGYESVKRRETTLTKLDHALEEIFGKDQWKRGEPIRFGKRARLNYAYHDGPVRKLLTELRECKWDIMLSNSVKQLYLAKQPSQLHPLDYENLDYLQGLCELALVQKQAKHNSNAGPFNEAGTDPADMFSPYAEHVPGGDKGLGSKALPQRPAPLQSRPVTEGGCGYDNGTVFCPECFDTADHQGHGVEMITARVSGKAFCDCGHPRAVKRPMTCAIHGTMIPEK
ncbi:E3 ubiquitin-protein ligase ubr11 [Apiospora phragmitis]|uniref:E3 ubiquitin-protein ligase ubr11 n=1 Tax=Apiospora phragmitis TaxID=2905665 RepID=A0ABR1W008_9PEZI